MKLRKFIDEKVAEIAHEKIVLDVGGGERFSKWLREYKHLFKDTDYKTFDYDRATGADVIGDIHNIPLAEGAIDAVICNCVLEHVENPIIAVRELHRILRPGGKMLVHVPSTYPYHARKGHYPDYWRFFDDTIQILFKDFSTIEVKKRGGYFKALMFFTPLQHVLRPVLEPIADFLDMIFKTESRSTTAGYYIYAVK